MKKTQPAPPDMLTIPQAADYTQTSRQNIWSLINRNKIKAIRFGHVALIPRSTLDEYLQTKEKGGRPTKKKSSAKH